jgi:hypothetical protein
MGYEDSLNLYQAFNQNPVNFVDPMGEDYYSSEYYKRLTRNAKPITWEEIDTALTGISEATRWGVQRVVNLGLGLIQSAGHLINSIFIPGYGNRDHYFYSLDLEDPSGYSVSVDSRPSYQKVAGYSGGDMAKLPEHLYEAGKSGIKMLDPTLSSSERKQHAKRFVEGLTDAGVLVWCGYKYYKNYKAISPNYKKIRAQTNRILLPGKERSALLTGSNQERQIFVSGVKIRDIRTGNVYEGTVNLKPTLDRISAGQRFPHRNDGAIFHNRPLRGKITPELPVNPQGYYKEYVHPTPGISGPGPQRIIIGKGGEIYYTPDHYTTFIKIK